MPSNERHKMAFVDIETTSLDAEMGRVLCACIKPFGEKTKLFTVRSGITQKELLGLLNDALSQYRIIVTYYGSDYRFDIPFLNSRMLAEGLPVLPPIAHVDIYTWAKRSLRLNRNRLINVSELMGFTDKGRVEPRIWREAARFDPCEKCHHVSASASKALVFIENHCVDDVVVLEKVYRKIHPLISTHPSIAWVDRLNRTCPVCGGNKIQKRGIYLTSRTRYDRMFCVKCAHWFKENPQRVKYGEPKEETAKPGTKGH